MTKLRALELVEFRKVLIMDISMVVRKARSVDNLFAYETPAAARNNAGLLLLRQSRSKFSSVVNELTRQIARGPCGPLKEYLNRIYPEWNEIPWAFSSE